MKTAITGATGQLGKIVVEKLKSKLAADNIVALVRNTEKAATLGIEARTFDYSHPETLSAALEGIDTILLISGNEVGQRLTQHTNVIEAAKAAGVKRIVYTSLLHADTSNLVLAGEHLATEKLIKESGLAYTILRNGWYTENYESSITAAVQFGALVGSSGEGKISSATREDFAEAAAVVLATKGHEAKTYELAADEAFTMNDLARIISEVSGKEITYNNLPVEEYAKVLENAGLPEGAAQFFAGTHVGTEKGDLFDDSKQLSTLIGRPTTNTKEYVASLLA